MSYSQFERIASARYRRLTPLPLPHPVRSLGTEGRKANPSEVRDSLIAQRAQAYHLPVGNRSQRCRLRVRLFSKQTHRPELIVSSPPASSSSVPRMSRISRSKPRLLPSLLNRRSTTQPSSACVFPRSSRPAREMRANFLSYFADCCSPAFQPEPHHPVSPTAPSATAAVQPAAARRLLRPVPSSTPVVRLRSSLRLSSSPALWPFRRRPVRSSCRRVRRSRLRTRTRIRRPAPSPPTTTAATAVESERELSRRS